MSVTLTRVKSSVDAAEKNPWDSVDLTQFLFYCCPDCQFQCQRDFLLRSHLNETHPESCHSGLSKKTSEALRAEKLIEKFLKENHHDHEAEDNFNLPKCIEVIKNPPLTLDLPNFCDSSPNPFLATDSKEANKCSTSVVITNKKSQDSLESFIEDNGGALFDSDDFDANTKVEEEEEELKPDLQKEEDSMNIEKDSKKCQDCSIVFLTPFRLLRHIKKFHGGVTPTMANSDTPIGDDSNVAEMPRPYSCQLCQKSFTSHAYLASHIRKAHEKRFRCEECGKSYGGSSYLREHIEAVHRKTKNFTCESCAASFYSKTQLTNHCLRNHSEGDERPCVDCGKLFTNELSLKLHLRNVHQPVKSMCSQCGKEYPNEVSLKKHVQCVHEKKRPFQCHICSKMFGSKWYVQQHVLKMHEDVQRMPSFKCSDCDFEFASMRERNAHVLKDHGKKFVGGKAVKKSAKFIVSSSSQEDHFIQMI